MWSLLGVLLGLFKLQHNSYQSTETLYGYEALGGGVSRRLDEDPGPDANTRRDYAKDVLRSQKEKNGVIYSDVSYIKNEIASSTADALGYITTINAEERRDTAKEEATKDVIVLMVHNFPFTTRCMQKRALLMQKEIGSLDDSRFYIAHYLDGHNKTFMKSAEHNFLYASIKLEELGVPKDYTQVTLVGGAGILVAITFIWCLSCCCSASGAPYTAAAHGWT